MAEDQDQYAAICETAVHIADMIEGGYDVVITHGNGPQVGFALRRSEIAERTEGIHPVPLANCGVYPKIVGNSVGLPSIWVFVAVIMGGKLMGILGMLFFIPLFSVLYSEISQLIKIRLGIRNIAAEKWENPPLLPQFLAVEKNSDTKKPEKPVAEEEENE